MENRRDEGFKTILDRYYNQISWLNSLITDPQGLRYLRKKSKEERINEFITSRDKMTAFLNFLGNPQEKYPSIHIAGTGGKGSVTMMIGRILEAVGFKTGIHTNPYLQVPIEKWILAGKTISPSHLAQAIESLRAEYEKFVSIYPLLRPSYDKFQVALTHKLFVDEKVDFGVIETGMGGRYDPSNILSPEISIITNIDFDHVKELGPSLTDIALHKAGIIKSNTPVITAVKQDEVINIIEQEAKKTNSPVFRLGRDFSYEIVDINDRGSLISIKMPNQNFKKINIPLPGIFQAENVTSAVMVCEILSQKKSFNLSEEIINKGLSNLVFPGRMETMQNKPLVIIDGAHNPQKTEALSRTMKKLHPNRKYTLIIGMLATKDARQTIAPLLPQATRVITTAPHIIGKPSLTSNQTLQIIKEINSSINIISQEDVTEAIKTALQITDKNEVILITGSLYMIGEARNYWYPKEKILYQAEFEHKQ